MSLFNRNTDPGAIDRIQNSEFDPRSQSEQFINDFHNRLMIDGTHPWHATDAEQTSAAMAAVAFAQDRTAEILRDTATVGRRNDRLPHDVAQFCLELSDTSQQHMRRAQSIANTDPHLTLDDQILSDLQPENMMPYWPLYSSRSQYGVEAWQQRPDDDARPSHEVSGEFVRGIIAATQELEGHADHSLRSLTEDPVFQTPGEYTSLRDTVNTYLFNETHTLIDLDASAAGWDHLTADQQAEVYSAVHGQFIKVMQGYIAAACPATLGPDFAPQR